MSDTDPGGLAAFTSEPIAERRAAWLVHNRGQLGEVTKADLGRLIGLRAKAAITDVQRRAAVRLRPLGETLTEPHRGNGHRSGATTSAVDYVASLGDRVQAIAGEMGRYRANAAAVAAGGTASAEDLAVFGELADALIDVGLALDTIGLLAERVALDGEL